MKIKQKASKLSKQSKLTRMLLEKVPQTPIPQPYFSIPSPEPYTFPLSQTMLEGIKLLQNFFPEEINIKIRSQLKGRIQRMNRFKDTYCMMGKGGNGLLIGDSYLQVRGITAYCYGPRFLIVAYEDLRLDVYNMQLKLIKSLKNFTLKKISFLKILSVPANYENIIIMTNSGNDLLIHRIEKSMFSTLSCKYTKKIISNLQFPITQITQMPSIFKYYLRKDASYKDCNLICVSAINCIFILKINHFRLNMDSFCTIDYNKRVEQATTNTLSWGQTQINSSTRDIKGDKLVLTYTFGSKVHFLVFKEIQKYQDSSDISIKCEWVQSFPFTLSNPNQKVAFCQYMKKNQLLIVTDDNYIIIFLTKNFDIFDKPISQDDIECMKEKFPQNLQARVVTLIKKKQAPSSLPSTQTVQNHLIQLKKQIQEFQSDKLNQQFQLINKQPLVSYADTFQYQYPSNQIFFLTEKHFGVYVYCDWRRISDQLKVQQRYQCAMVFLIAIYKKANKFDLGMGEGSNFDQKSLQANRYRQKQLSEYIQFLVIEFINNKLLKIRQIPQIFQNIMQNEEFFKLLIIPIQFLCETQQFTFLFQVIKDKIISSLIPQTNLKKQNQKNFRHSQKVFYTVLSKFIEHGRIKYIPQSQLQIILDYYLKQDQSDMVDRLAIYFDLERIDTNIVVQCLLNNNLVVSLAHICTQGNQSLFVTPFVKFWGVSQNYKRLKKQQEAAAYALRALWYMKLCLQRNWALKQYTLQKYSRMICILSNQFLNEKILIGLLQVRPEYCLQTLSLYFTIQNSQIVNEMDIKIPGTSKQSWIVSKPDNEKIQLLLSAISYFVNKATKGDNFQFRKNLCLFLSGLIIYKTVKYSQQKYFQVVMQLINFNKYIKEINYGLEEKMIDQFRTHISVYGQFQQNEIEEILAARYIIKILTLVFYECQQFLQKKFYDLIEESRKNRLIDLQAQILYLQANYNSCIDLYMTSKNSHKMLIFQFLDSSFKRLVLQKKKQQKKELSKCIKNQIKSLVLLNPRKTKNLVQGYIPEIQQELIIALSDDENLQLDYLLDIINDQFNPTLKQKLSQPSMLKFVQLMAKNKPEQLRESLKSNTFFPVQQSLHICQKYQVYDCIQYLYQRMGCISQAVKIAALRIDKILKTRNQYGQEDFMPYIQIKQILDNALDICKKNHSEEIWQALLDSSIDLYRKYSDSQLPEDEVQIFFFINGEIMENLASNCTIQHTINLLQNKYNNLNMGGKMTKAFINILNDLSHSINILYLSTNLMQGDLQKQLYKDYVSKLRCYRPQYCCETCHYAIMRRQQSIHFQCGHSYHKQCVVYQDPMTCIECLMNRTDQFTYYLNTLNPKFPKIKKINQLFEKFSEKRFQMNEIFKIQQFQKSEEVHEKQIVQIIKQKKQKKFQFFDQKVYEIEQGDRRVQSELQISSNGEY